MNRRKAIINTVLLGGGTLGAFFLGKFYRIFEKPNITFLKSNSELIDELTETVIPKTDSPGAKDVQVGKFLITMIQECTNRSSQNNFIHGLEDLIGYAESTYGKSFLVCDRNEKEHVLNYFESELRDPTSIFSKVEKRILGEPFITLLKKYSVHAYCTSELGATTGLSYDYIPGKFVGVTLLKPGQKAWATQ
jgi:hypothetical protein